jgi:hypothetical protein
VVTSNPAWIFLNHQLKARLPIRLGSLEMAGFSCWTDSVATSPLLHLTTEIDPSPKCLSLRGTTPWTTSKIIVIFIFARLPSSEIFKIECNYRVGSPDGDSVCSRSGGDRFASRPSLPVSGVTVFIVLLSLSGLL